MPVDVRRSSRRCCSLALCAVVLAACEPELVFAGGRIGGVGVGERFYIAASDGADARWAQAIEADSRVRLKVGERVFRLAAERVLDAAELNDVATAYAAKYDTDREQSFVDAAWVHRLSPR